MADETKHKNSEAPQKNRREFVTAATKVAVTAPVVAMLLSASTKPSTAQTIYQPSDDGPIPIVQ
jgi:hypothetical protein